MSTIVMSACWPLQMPPTPKAVLISLADNANDHGECWPSITKICERTCFGRTAVIDAIKWLEDQGVVLADRSNGRHSRYSIDLSRLQQGALFNSEPVRQADQYAKRTGTRNGPHQSVKRTTPVRQADTNHQEPSRTVTKNITPQLDFSGWPSKPSPQVLADWLHVRKKRKADVTPTVMKTFGKELHKAASMGFSVDDCLSKCVTRNWTGFEAEWIERDVPRGTSRAGPNGAPGKQMQGIMALEGLKSGNRLDAGRDRDGAAEALPALVGPNTGR